MKKIIVSVLLSIVFLPHFAFAQSGPYEACVSQCGNTNTQGTVGYAQCIRSCPANPTPTQNQNTPAAPSAPTQSASSNNQAPGRCVNPENNTDAGVQNYNLYPNGCPPGSNPVGSNNVGGKAVNGNLTYTPLEPLSTSQKTPSDFCGVLNLLFKALIYTGGMIAVLFLVIDGITYMVSEVVNKKKAARERLEAALLGLAILLGAYMLLNSLNPNLVGICSILNPANATGIVNQTTTSSSAAAAIAACKNAQGAIKVVPYNSSGPQDLCAGQQSTSRCGLSACNNLCSTITAPSNNAPGLICLTQEIISVPATQ